VARLLDEPDHHLRVDEVLRQPRETKPILTILVIASIQ